MGHLRGLSLQARLTLGLLMVLGLCAAGLSAVLARTYNAQLQALARNRLENDAPLLKNQLDSLRFRNLHMVQLMATNPEVVAGTDAHDGAALDRVLGPLRSQSQPAAQYLMVIDPKGQIVATDPFINVNFANDGPVKDALAGRSSLNLANTTNVAFQVRNVFPPLSIEAAWPVKSGSRTLGTVVMVTVIGDVVLDTLLSSTQLQAAVIAPQQKVMLAASSPLRQLYQQQRLPGLLDGLEQRGEVFEQAVNGDAPYYVLQTGLPTQPAAMRLLMAVPGKDMAAAATDLRRQLIGTAAAAFLALAAAGFLLLRWTLRPLRQLRRAAASVRQQGEDIELSKAAPAEVREIANALSGVAAELASALEAERGQRSHIEAIIDSMAEGVVVSDVSRRVTLVNPLAKRLLGINGGGNSETLLPLPPGELAGNSSVIKSRSAPIVSGDGRTTGYVTLLHDASEEAELDRLKSEFVGMVSHELRTPLTSIKGSVDLLLEAETGELNATQRRFLSTIRRSSDRLINLVNDLLDLSRLEAGRVQLDAHPLDARHLIEDTTANLANLFDARKQHVEIECEPGLPPILADRQRLEQALVNLLGNAGKYTPDGGDIRVSARRVDQQVEIAVSDSGPGLSPDDQRRVFDKFYRAGDGLTQQQTGSGLGLTIAKSLVELHGGTLGVESELGRGSTFRISMPTYEEED